jgi:hypothetical protein
MSTFRKALLWTAIPLVLLSLVGAVVTQLFDSNNEGPAAVLNWTVISLLIFAAFITGLVFIFIPRLRQTGAGLLAGSAIGIVAAGLSCFITLGTG